MAAPFRPTEESFDEERRTGIGGSDAAAVLGISPWKTPYDLYAEKIGEAEPIPVTEPMLWGTLLEPVIAEEYSRRTGRQLGFLKEAMLRHPAYDWLIGHIDARIIGEPRILECKATASYTGWGEPGTDLIPQHYGCQVQHYMALTDAQVCDVAALIAGHDFRLYTIERDDDIIGALLDKEHAFWQHVKDRVPPEPVNTRDAVRRWGRLSNPGTVVASAADAEAVARLRLIREQRRGLDEAEEEAKLALMSRLGEHGDTLVDLAGTPLATWLMDQGTKAYSVAAKEPRRRFLLKD